MRVFVVLGVFQGIVNDIEVYKKKDKAKKRLKELTKEYERPEENDVFIEETDIIE